MQHLSRAATAAALVAVLLAATCDTARAQLNSLPSAVADVVAANVMNQTFVFAKESTFQLDLAAGTWSTLTTASGTSTAASAVVKDTVVIVGGGGQEPTANCTLFSPASQAFKQCSQSMPSARGFLGAAAVNGVVYAVGGFAAKGWNIVESYDVASGSWTSGLESLPTPRYGLSVESVGGSLYAIGGVAWHVPASGAVEAYDVASNTWTSKSAMITPRAFMASTVYKDYIYTFGGNTGSANVETVEFYNPATDSWSTATSLAKPTRSHASAIYIPQHFMLVLGGSTGKGLQQRDIPAAEEYMPASV